MAHWQDGEKEEAQRYYGQAVKLMDQNRSGDRELQRFRTEAEKLLRIKIKKDDPGNQRSATSTGKGATTATQ